MNLGGLSNQGSEEEIKFSAEESQFLQVYWQWKEAGDRVDDMYGSIEVAEDEEGEIVLFKQGDDSGAENLSDGDDPVSELLAAEEKMQKFPVSVVQSAVFKELARLNILLEREGGNGQAAELNKKARNIRSYLLSGFAGAQVFFTDEPDSN